MAVNGQIGQAANMKTCLLVPSVYENQDIAMHAYNLSTVNAGEQRQAYS